jgi:hypothetical protein
MAIKEVGVVRAFKDEVVVSGIITVMDIMVEITTREMEAMAKITLSMMVIANLTRRTMVELSNRRLTLKNKEMAKYKRTLASKISAYLNKTSRIKEIKVATEVVANTLKTTKEVAGAEVATTTTINIARTGVDKATQMVVNSKIGSSRFKATGQSSLLVSIQEKVISKLDLLRKRLIKV